MCQAVRLKSGILDLKPETVAQSMSRKPKPEAIEGTTWNRRDFICILVGLKAGHLWDYFSRVFSGLIVVAPTSFRRVCSKTEHSHSWSCSED